MEPSDDFEVATALRDEIEATHAGFGNPSALITALRDAVLAIAVDEHHAPLVAEFGGLSWILGFTAPAELSAYGVARGLGGEPLPFATIPGDRLLDQLVPSCARPTGVAVDVASDRPMAFPPVGGIVPDPAVPHELRR